MIHIPIIELVYLSDNNIYKLWYVRHIDPTDIQYFIFQPLVGFQNPDGQKQFYRHETIQQAMLSATSYRSDIGSQLASQRGDFDYFLIDGHKVTNLSFLNFI